MCTMFLLLVLAMTATPSQAQADNQTNFTPITGTNFLTKMVDTARTLDIGSIDFQDIIQRLVSPTGLVTQFALEMEVQVIFTLGWIILGLIWQFAVANTSGSIQAGIQGLGFILSTQALATTVVRSVYDSIRSIISRLAVTFLVFGADATIAGISSVTLVDVTDFLFNPQLVLLVVGRGILSMVFVLAAALPIYLFSVGVYPTLKPQAMESRLSAPYPAYPDYNEYGDYTYSPTLERGDTVASALDNAMANIIQSIV